MRNIVFLLLAGCLGLGFQVSSKTGQVCKRAEKTYSKVSSGGFAVVELFTSEGCSSCPPADKVLAALQHDYEAEAVYILAYHVDYWDKLGWKDVFSQAAYSARQYQYVDWLRLESAYTPQMVINGTKEFVGSSESDVRSVITEALAMTSTVEFELNQLEISDDKVKVNYIIGFLAPNTSLLLNLVEKSATTKVLKGENKGHELAHVQVVREQQIISSRKAGTAYFKIPTNTDKKEIEIIAFLQNKTTGKITSAMRLSVSPKKIKP